MIKLPNDFRDKPIPEPVSRSSAADYHQVEIDLIGPANREQLIDVREYGIACKSIYSRPYAPYYRAFGSALEGVFVRDTVAQKLIQVNNILLDYGVEVLTLDGYRSVELQVELWKHFMTRALEQLPEASRSDLEKFASLYCSNPSGYDPDNFKTWPVHLSGGAIDLTLRSLYDKQEAFMGSIFDDADDVSFTTHFESTKLTSQSGIEARRNRRLLYHAMSAAGFQNYSYEWWHFDYGSQMWVKNGNLECKALYGRAELESGV